MAFHNCILDKPKYIIDTFQMSKLQFLTFCEEGPLEAYYQDSEKDSLFLNLYSFKLLSEKKKS